MSTNWMKKVFDGICIIIGETTLFIWRIIDNCILFGQKTILYFRIGLLVFLETQLIKNDFKEDLEIGKLFAEYWMATELIFESYYGSKHIYNYALWKKQVLTIVPFEDFVKEYLKETEA